ASRLAYLCRFAVRSDCAFPSGAFLGGQPHNPRDRPKSTLSASGLTSSPLSQTDQATPLHRDNQNPTIASLPRPPNDQHTQSGTGILPRFPSSTALALDLGAGCPGADDPGSGTLRLSVWGILPPIARTHSGIFTRQRSSAPPGTPSPH